MSTNPTPSRWICAARGFSLIELTLVIVIMGVLMAVVTVNLVGQGERAKGKATKASMRTIQMTLDQYQMEYSAYPPQLVMLQQPPLKLLPANDPIQDGWKREFLYRVPGSSGKAYDLISSGADVDDPSDDIDCWTMNQE